jgi:hypothetical protein
MLADLQSTEEMRNLAKRGNSWLLDIKNLSPCVVALVLRFARTNEHLMIWLTFLKVCLAPLN